MVVNRAIANVATTEVWNESLTELMKQPQYAPLSVEEQVCVIYAGTRGYLDKVAVNQIGKFEQGLLSYLRSEGKAILDAIRTEKAISDDTKGKLKAALDSFAKNFA